MGAAKGFPSKFWGIEHGYDVKVDGYAGGDNYLWRIGVCVRVWKNSGVSFPPIDARERSRSKIF